MFLLCTEDTEVKGRQRHDQSTTIRVQHDWVRACWNDKRERNRCSSSAETAGSWEFGWRATQERLSSSCWSNVHCFGEKPIVDPNETDQGV